MRSHLELRPFLPAEELAVLERFLHASQGAFTASRITSGASMQVELRRSRVLYDLGAYGDWFRGRLLEPLPAVLAMLGQPVYGLSGIELQATATSDGEFFSRHVDVGPAHLSRRVLSFTFFLHREPCPFTGGELMIYPCGGDAVTVAPRRNTIVFFPAGVEHEILPVECGSKAFADGRINVNGWFLR